MDMINRGFYTAFLLLLFSGTLFAGDNIKMGFTGGLCIFKYSEKRTEGWYEYRNKTGLVAGALLEIGIFKCFSIEQSIVYSMRGAYHEATLQDYPVPGEVYTVKYWFNYNYLAIPIRADIKYLACPFAAPYACIGLNTAFLLSAGKKTEEIGRGAPPIRYEDIDQYAIDIGLDLGAGFERDIGKFTPFVEYVYYVGMKSILKYSTDKIKKHKGMEIKAGLKFNT
jgi:hypothetical protein